MFPYSFPKLHHTVLEGPELSGELWSHVGLICINCEVCLKQNKGQTCFYSKNQELLSCA